MPLERIDIEKAPYLYDLSSRIVIKEGQVYRVFDDKEKRIFFRDFMNNDNLDKLFRAGLVHSEIIEDSLGFLIIEHAEIPFILHPCEYTNHMFWKAAEMFIGLNLELSKHGLITQDSHPWNISYSGKKPIFYDLGSIAKGNEISRSWYNEFFYFFMIPIWLASKKRTVKFSKEYRREHKVGFGRLFFKSKKLEDLLFRKLRSILKLRTDPEKFFEKISQWLQEHKPIVPLPEYWSNYYDSTGMNFQKPESIKEKFVFNILNSEKPMKVLDLASNKGYFSHMAAYLGANVLAIDYEEEVVDSITFRNEYEELITPAHMDFKQPTPSFGPGLSWGDSFERFGSEIVLAIGLIHHICITQKIPVYIFCQSCMKYAKKGIILEFVDPSDKHVREWKKPIPMDYCIEKVVFYMEKKFPYSQIREINNIDGINRTFIYFSTTPLNEFRI